MTPGRPPPRRLHAGHFAFMRAVAQGLDERVSWDRYLRLEGEHSDIRTVRRTIAWIRDEFAAAARREMRPGTARLVLLDPARLQHEKVRPSLEEFAAVRGLEDFAESEQLEAYEAAYPVRERTGEGAGRLSRRARLIDRQLEAIRWLQDLSAHEPRAGDDVSSWLHPALSSRLATAGITTLSELVERINGVGARWWAKVPGVGALKAARILDWLRANEDVLGLRIGAHVAQSRSRLTPQVLAAVRPPATALAPFEKFVPPAALDGRAGRFRAPRHACRLRADDDHAAIALWLASKRSGEGASATPVPLSATQRSYRREAERLLLWAVLERGKALSSLSGPDIADFQDFLRAPPENWCGPRHHQRWSPLWRPLERALAPAALRQTVIILRSLFTYLVAEGYMARHPLERLAPMAPAARTGPGRSLSAAEWRLVDAHLARHGATEPERRLRRAMRWLHATGWRIGELAQATCNDLSRTASADGDGGAATWCLALPERATPRRAVVVPAPLVDDLSAELARHGFDGDVTARANQGIPILARFGIAGPPVAWSSSGVYQAMKKFLAHTAASLDAAPALRITQASAQWLRDTAGRDEGRPASAGHTLDVVETTDS